MKNNEKLKEFRELSGLTKKEVVTLGEYQKSEQWYGKIENGIAGEVSDAALQECYTAINIGRCKKQQGIIPPKDKETHE